MKILLCNDDGIHARGLAVLHEVAQEFGDVTIVAPDAERSAAGHAITLNHPIRAVQVEKQGQCYGWAVSGTPADCIKLAVSALLESPPDLVVSGINLGSNTGVSVLYSGTVSAAMEGLVLGIPSMALSLCAYTDPCWETARVATRRAIRNALENGIPANTLLNINIPNRRPAELAGVRTTVMGRSRWIEKFHRRTDPQGNIYYWLDGDLTILDQAENMDVKAVERGYVAVTPIQIDMTHHAALPGLNGWQTEGALE